MYLIVRCGSAVDIAAAYGLNDREVGVPSPSRIKNFHFSISSRSAVGAIQPPIQCVPRASP
jgi:hypothetical protein